MHTYLTTTVHSSSVDASMHQPQPLRRIYKLHSSDSVEHAMHAFIASLTKAVPVLDMFPTILDDLTIIVDRPHVLMLLHACLELQPSSSGDVAVLKQASKLLDATPIKLWTSMLTFDVTASSANNHSTPTSTPTQHQISLAKELVPQLLREEVWSFATRGRDATLQPVDRGEDGHKVEDVLATYKSVVASCVLLETIAQCAKVLGSEFTDYVIDGMYCIMLHVGLPQGRVAESARYCLDQAAQACGHASASDMVTANADYLINDAILRIRYMAVDPQAAYSVQQLLDYAAPSLLLAVKDMMLDVFVALDGYQPMHATQFILILLSVMQALERWYNSDALPVDYDHYDHTGLRSSAKRMKTKTETADDDNPDPPPHVNLVIDALQRIKHLLGDDNPQHRVLLLNAACLGFKVLNPFERQLLPQVAQLWPPILACMQDEVPWVAAAAIDVLPTMARVSGSFLRDRMNREAVPVLLPLLKRQQSILMQKEDYAARKDGPHHKLAAAILRVLGSVWRELSPSAKEVRVVTQVAVLFLHASLDDNLHNTCVELLQALSQLDADVVWYELAKRCPPEPLFQHLDQLTPQQQHDYKSQLGPPQAAYAHVQHLYAKLNLA
eukprot:TRINITY_DN11133_c0_g1_i3.p1 TRINITY_DN11133_c0_g1~~TRINITY_DN11133_c0_g1_i3.p1  ORF type:complete len:690 (+),score=160.88 TRINITY_DN11133_c0_g1_i3:236-2071(+)